jgi:hypothetical protein
MRKLVPFLFLIAVLAACDGSEGPVGPQGPPGVPGEDGVNIESFVFEYENVDFTAPEYTVTLAFSEDFNFEGQNTDVVLAYLLWDVVEIDGVPTDVWRALPQSLITENGLLQYNYDFTSFDAQLFLSTDFDKSLLEPIDTDDWIVRLVVVPGKFFNPDGKMENVNLDDYHEVIEAMGYPKKPLPDSYNDIERRN